MKYSTKAKLLRHLPIISVLLAAILAVSLYFLVSDYNKKEAIKRDELHNLDLEMYEEIKNNDNYFDSSMSPGDRELAEKLKKYNFYEKLREQLQVNVLFLGNAVTDGMGVADYNDRWVNKFVKEIEEGYGSDLKGFNYGKDGSEAFYGYNMLNYSKEKNAYYDLIIVSYGATDDPADFVTNYDGLLHSIKEQNPKCEIYCLIEAAKAPIEENISTVRELCEFYGGICIDISKYFEDHNVDLDKTLLSDGLTPNEKGNIHYYNCISEVLKENFDSGRKIPNISESYLSSGKSFENYSVIKRDGMKQIGDTVFEVSVKGEMLSLIYLKSYTDGGAIKIYVNGKKLQTVDNKQTDNNAGKEIDFSLVASGLHGVSKIRIETGSKDNALNFYGIATSGKK